MPNVAPDQIGLWLLCAIGVLYGAKLARETWWPTQSRDEQAVSQAEFAQKLSAFEQRHKELHEYVHQSVHELRNGLNMVSLQLTALKAESDHSTRTLDKLLAMADTVIREQVRIATLLTGKPPVPLPLPVEVPR